jgi:hypothetical protein
MMKKMSIISIVLIGLMLSVNCLAGDLVHKEPVFNSQNIIAQNAAKSDSATSFPKESKPGLYVDNRIGFAVLYPEEWTPANTQGREIFRAEPEMKYPSFRVWFLPNLQMPLKSLSKMWTSMRKDYSKDEIKVVYDLETKSESGVGAQEIELEWITNENTPRPNLKVNTYCFGIKNSNGWIVVGVTSVNGLVQEDIKKKIHFIELKPETGLSG